MTRPPTREQYRYMSLCPRRSPEWKAHRNIGHAKSAILSQMSSWGGNRFYDMEIWEWDSDINDWALLYEIPKNMSKEQLPWKNTPAETEKRRVLSRKEELRRLERKFVSEQDLDNLAKVWKATPNKPLREQLGNLTEVE